MITGYCSFPTLISLSPSHCADLPPGNETTGYIFIHAEGGLNQQRIAVSHVMLNCNLIDEVLVSYFLFSLCTHNWLTFPIPTLIVSFIFLVEQDIFTSILRNLIEIPNEHFILSKLRF